MLAPALRVEGQTPRWFSAWSSSVACPFSNSPSTAGSRASAGVNQVRSSASCCGAQSPSTATTKDSETACCRGSWNGVGACGHRGGPVSGKQYGLPTMPKSKKKRPQRRRPDRRPTPPHAEFAAALREGFNSQTPGALLAVAGVILSIAAGADDPAATLTELV